MGRYEECVPKYLDALSMDMDNRSRFVILVNLGTVYLTLGNIDKLVTKQPTPEQTTDGRMAVVYDGPSGFWLR